MSVSDPLLINSIWFRYVLEPAARALIVAGAAWLILVAFRVRDVSLRLAVWTAILYAALAMPFLSRVVPKISLPVLSAQTAAQAGGKAALSRATSDGPVMQLAVFHGEMASSREISGSADSRIAAAVETAGRPAVPWPAIAISVYLLLVMVFLSRLVLGLVSSRRLRRASTPVWDGRFHQMLARETRKAGLRRLPGLAESAALSVPATLGWLRPVILVPLEWTRWNESEMRAVLAHELSHISRRDGLTQTLSRLHRAIFWFSPLSWWLDRALVELAEQASDDAALRSGADRVGYAEVLLHFFRALKAARGRVRWEGVSMAQGSRSARRVERVLESTGVSRGLGLVALAALALVAVPLICLAAAVEPSRVSTLPLPQPVAPAPPPFALTLPPATSPAPEASAPSVPRVFVEPARDVRPWKSAHCQVEQAFAVVSSGAVIGGYGSVADFTRVWNLSALFPGNFLWFRSHGRDYIVRNPIIVKAALEAISPLKSLEQQQAMLNWEQSIVARDQYELAVRRLAVNAWVPGLASEWDNAAGSTRTIASSPTSEQLAPARAAVARSEWLALQARMERIELVAEDLRAVSRQQAALDLVQNLIGHQQAELAAQQRELAHRALGLTRNLMYRSLQRGLAVPI